MRRPVSVAERREWDRLPISIPFFVRGRKLTGEEFLEFATALNLSAGGVLLATRRYLDPGTQISLEVPVALVNKAQLPQSVSLSMPQFCAVLRIANIIYLVCNSSSRSSPSPPSWKVIQPPQMSENFTSTK